MLIQDLRDSLRLLRRTPGFTALCWCSPWGSARIRRCSRWVNAMLLRPMPGRIGELVGVFNRDRNRPDDSSIVYWSVRAGAAMFSAFGVLALMLATIDIYGLKAYDVSRRTREIGIRMALGANSGDVERLVMSEGARTTIIGLGIGLVLAAGVGKLLSGMLFQVGPFDLFVMAAAAVVLSTSAMPACYLPARRATRIVPLEALRTE